MRNSYSIIILLVFLFFISCKKQADKLINKIPLVYTLEDTCLVKKNNALLFNSNDYYDPSSIFVSAGDVYVTTLNKILKNGQSILSNPNAFFYDVYVVGANVYVVGRLNNAPTLWKNGSPVTLSSSGSAYSITVAGSDVYVCGVTPQGPTFWKNGVSTVLSSSGYAR